MEFPAPPGFPYDCYAATGRLRFSGLDFSKYEKAALKARYAFRQALTRDIAENLDSCTDEVRITQLSGPVFEVDFEVCSPSHSKATYEATGQVLAKRVHNGTFTTGNTRQSYQKELGGSTHHMCVDVAVLKLRSHHAPPPPPQDINSISELRSIL